MTSTLRRIDECLTPMLITCVSTTASNAVHQVDAEGPILVIGAGLGRTGTMSLQAALEIIYGQPCYHMKEVVSGGRKTLEKWAELCKAIMDDPNVDIPASEFKELFRGYRCTTDHPGMAFVFQLMKVYPEAKVVLSIRDAKAWLGSVRETIRPNVRRLSKGWVDKLIARFTTGEGFFDMAENSMKAALGKTVDMSDDEQVMAAFNAWNVKVQRDVPSDRLLVFSVKSGWEPLCNFLNVPIPNEPFPHVNERAQLKSRFVKFDYMRTTIKLVVYSTCMAGIGFAAYKLWQRYGDPAGASS